MKRFVCLILAVLLVLSLCACGKANTAESSKPASTPALPAPEAPETSKAPVSEESLIDDPAWDQLESLGKVTTENGIFYVTITIPANMVGADTTQESLDAKTNKNFTSAKLNDDGSVTIKDVTILIDFLLGSNPQPFNGTNADVNVNGSVTIADVTTLIDMLLLN